MGEAGLEHLDPAQRQWAAQALIAEYTAMRREIDVYHGHQERAITYTLIGLGVWLGVLDWLGTHPDYSFVLLLFPLIFCMFGFLFADKMVRIYGVADYLHNGLRPKLIALCGTTVLQWETHKKFASSFSSQTFPIVLDLSRWTLFLLPGAVSLSVYVMQYRAHFNRIFDVFIFVVSVLMLLGLLVYIQLVRAKGGIKSRRVDLDQYETHVRALVDDGAADG